MKTLIPEDQPVYDELLDLNYKFRSSMDCLKVYFTDAANCMLEGDYITTDQHLNTIFNYHSELNVYILAAIQAFKKHMGEWE